MPPSLRSNLPQHPQPPPQEISVILDHRIYYLKLGHRRKDYKLSADDWFFDFLIERNPEWLVPLLQDNKGAISLSFGSHQNCMECIVVLAEEAACQYQKEQQEAARRKQEQRRRRRDVNSSPPCPRKQPSASPSTTSSSSSIYTATHSLPSFQLQVQATVQVQIKKKKQQTSSSSCSPNIQTNTKLRLWKSLSDQIVGLGIHNSDGNDKQHGKQQEVSLELTLEKNNKNHLGAHDPSRVRTVLLQRRKENEDPSFSTLQLQTMRVQPNPRRGASKPRQVVTVWNLKEEEEATLNSITSAQQQQQQQQQVSAEDDGDTCNTKQLGLQVQHVPTRVHSMASPISNSEPLLPPTVDDHTLHCEYYHLNSNPLSHDNNDDEHNDNEHSVVEEYTHLNPLEFLEAAWEAEEEFADQQREQEESSASVPQQSPGRAGPIVMNVVHTPCTKRTSRSRSETQASSNSDIIMSKPKRTKMPKQPSPSKKRRMAHCSENPKRPAMPQHPKDLTESSSPPTRTKMSKQPSAFKKQKMALSSSIIMDSNLISNRPAVAQHAIDLTMSPPFQKVPCQTPPLEVAAPLAGEKEANAKSSQVVVADKALLIHNHNPLGSIGAVVKACSSNIYNVLTGKRRWGSNNSAAHVAVQDSRRLLRQKENQVLSCRDDEEAEFEPPNVVSTSRWASVESMDEGEISKSPYEASVNAEVGEPIFDKVKALFEPNESGGWSRRKEASEEAITCFGSTLAKSLVIASSEIANSGMLYGSEWREGTIRGVRVGCISKPMLLLCLQEQRFARGNDAVLAKVIQDLEIDDMVKEGMEEWGIESDYSSLSLTKRSFVFTSMKAQCHKCEVFVARAYTFMKALKLESIDNTLMAKVRACLKIMEANVRVPKGKERRKRKKTASVAEAAQPVKIPKSTSDTIDADGKPCINVIRRVSDSTAGRDSEDASQSSVECKTALSISPKNKQRPTTNVTSSTAVPKDKLDQSSNALQKLSATTAGIIGDLVKVQGKDRALELVKDMAGDTSVSSLFKPDHAEKANKASAPSPQLLLNFSAATTGMIGDLVKIHGKDGALELVKHMTGDTLVSSPSKSGHAGKTKKASVPSPQLPLNSSGLNLGGGSTQKSKLPRDHNDIPRPGRERPRSTLLLEPSKTNTPHIDSKEVPVSKTSMDQDSRHGAKDKEKEDPPRKAPLDGTDMQMGHALRVARDAVASLPVDNAAGSSPAKPKSTKLIGCNSSPPTEDKGVLPRGTAHMDDARRSESRESCSVSTKDAKDLPGAPKLAQNRNNDLNEQNQHLDRPIEMISFQTGNMVKQFGSVDEAASALSTRQYSILRVLTGERKSHVGYFFRYQGTRTALPKIIPGFLSSIIDTNRARKFVGITDTPFDNEAGDSPTNTSAVDLRSSHSSGRVDGGNTKLDERPIISSKAVGDPRDSLTNTSAVDLRNNRSSGRVDDGNTKLDLRPMISSKAVGDPRDLPDEVTHVHSSSRWVCVASMDTVSVSPYEASTNAEVGEPIFDKVKTLLVANEGGGSKRHKEASDDAIKLFGPTLAKSLVLANHQIALSGILYGSEWRDGTIRGFRYGFIPKSMLLLCLQEQRFGRGDNEAVMVKIIQDLGVDGTVKEAMAEWGIESDYNNLATAPGTFVFTSLKAQCHRCEVFVARAYTFLKVLKARSINDSLMAKVKSCLKIMETNVRASPPLRKRKKSTPSVGFAPRKNVRTCKPPAIGLLTKVGPVAVKNSKIGSDGVVLEACEPPLALSSNSHMLEVTSATIEGYLWTVSNKTAEMTKAPPRKVEKICPKTGKVLETHNSANAARVAMQDDSSSIFLALSGIQNPYRGGFWRYAGSSAQPPGCATLAAFKCVDEPQRHKLVRKKHASPQVKPVPPNQPDDDVIDLTDDVDDEPQASEAEELHSFGGLRHILFSKLGATCMVDGAKEGPLLENKSSSPATGAATGTSSGGVRHGVLLKPPPIAVADGAAGYLPESDTASEATRPETKPASLLKSHKTPLLFPRSSGMDEATPWYPHDYDEIILNATEIEVAWLVEESIYGLRNREIQWDFVWEYASQPLRIQLRKVDFARGKELEQLIRFQDVLVSKRFPVKRKLIRRELHRGNLRVRMREVVPKLRLAGRELIGLVKSEQA